MDTRNNALMNRPLSNLVTHGVGPGAPQDVCTTFAGSYTRNRIGAFANVYAWSGALATVDFNTGSDHTLGVAVGSGSKWSASGTTGISTGAGATVSNVADATAVNRVNYRDFKNICWSKTHRKPVSFYALLPTGDFTYAQHQNYSHCASYTPGGTFWKTKGKNLTYSTGVDLPYVNVSAQSGWKTDTKIGFTITKNSWLCGNTDGWANAKAAEAHKR